MIPSLQSLLYLAGQTGRESMQNEESRTKAIRKHPKTARVMRLLTFESDREVRKNRKGKRNIYLNRMWVRVCPETMLECLYSMCVDVALEWVQSSDNDDRRFLYLREHEHTVKHNWSHYPKVDNEEVVLFNRYCCFITTSALQEMYNVTMHGLVAGGWTIRPRGQGFVLLDTDRWICQGRREFIEVRILKSGFEILIDNSNCNWKFRTNHSEQLQSFVDTAMELSVEKGAVLLTLVYADLYDFIIDRMIGASLTKLLHEHALQRTVLHKKSWIYGKVADGETFTYKSSCRPYCEVNTPLTAFLQVNLFYK